MRELTEKEMESIAGGGYIADMAAEWGAIGTVVGYVADTTIAGATRGGLKERCWARPTRLDIAPAAMSMTDTRTFDADQGTDDDRESREKNLDRNDIARWIPCVSLCLH
jgi:hypothetical protein